MNRPIELSLCLIVRNEAELLPEFLRHAAGLWDELVAVDTGSQDETIGLLEAAGARVIRREWTDDFAAARNAGLSEARGRWILFLDADEMVTAELAAEIRGLLADHSAGAATVQMRNLLPHGHHRQTGLLRLFRNDPSIRFRHRIHEEVATTVQAYLRRQGLRLRHLASTVLHLGYTRERAEARDKKQRDSRLLRRSVTENPADFYSWFKLLELARFWSDGDMARQVASDCLPLLEGAGPTALAGEAFGGELVALLAGALHSDDPSRARQLMARWESALLPSAAFELRAGELAERQGHFQEASQRFHRCLDLEAETADVQLATVRPLMGLARIALARGAIDEAGALTDRALAHNGRDREALLAAVAICEARGGPDLVLRFATRHVQQHGQTEELTQTLAELAPGVRLPSATASATT